MINRTKTGIPGFDKLTEGGLPTGSNILLSGSPSTGKTIFGLQYLYQGAKDFDEPGLYISYEESQENLIRTAEKLGFNIRKLMDQKKIILKTFQKEPLVLQTLIADIKRQVKGYNIKRIVIDSLTTLLFRKTDEELNNKNQMENNKRFVSNLILDLSQIQETTKILISEVEGDDERRLASESVSPFLCDGIIFIKYRTMGGINSRELVIRKMRLTNHATGFHPLQITKRGILIKELSEDL